MEDNKQSLGNKLNDLIKISIFIGIISISFSISYYFVIFLPQQEKMKIEKAQLKEVEVRQKEDNRQANLEICLKKAEAENRRLQIMNATGPKGTMPLDLYNALDKRFKNATDECYKKYPPTK